MHIPGKRTLAWLLVGVAGVGLVAFMVWALIPLGSRQRTRLDSLSAEEAAQAYAECPDGRVRRYLQGRDFEAVGLFPMGRDVEVGPAEDWHGESIDEDRWSRQTVVRVEYEPWTMYRGDERETCWLILGANRDSGTWQVIDLSWGF